MLDDKTSLQYSDSLCSRKETDSGTSSTEPNTQRENKERRMHKKTTATKPKPKTTTATKSATVPKTSATNSTSRKATTSVQRKASPTKKQVSKPVPELQTLFQKYSQLDETDASGIGGDGIMQFASDIGIDPMEIDLLVWFWKMKLTQQYFISEEQWTKGMKENGMDTLSTAKSKLPKLKNCLSNDSDFTDFYMFCFNYMKEPDQKNLALENATALWRLSLKGRYKYVEDWCTYMETVNKHSVPIDLWRQFLQFTRDPEFKSFATFDLSMNSYPSAIDEFVEYALKQGLDTK